MAWNELLTVAKLSKLVFRHTTTNSMCNVSPFSSLLLRAFSTSMVAEGKTQYYFIRVPRSMPNIPVPAYLKDGSVKRNHKKSGRDPETGRIAIRHKGGGHPQTFRIVDFVRAPVPQENEEPKPIRDKVLHIGYDPCRSGRIALVAGDGSNRMKIITAPHEMKVGDVITAFRGKPQSIARLKPGDAYPLAHLPIGTVVYNVELQPGKGAQLVRAAGTCAQILNKTETTARLRLPSKQEKDIPLDCLATLGRVSNIDHENRVIGKAGRNRWLNRKPKGQTGINRTLWRKKRV